MSNIPTLRELRDLFSKQKLLPTTTILNIIHQAQHILQDENNIIQLRTPITIIGDIHGQFYDLMHLSDLAELEKDNDASNQFLFLGDYVDRGAFSCEVMIYLLVLKILRPNHIFLLRGNHETEAISSFYGFRIECKMKYGVSIYYHFVQLFQSLPLAAIVESKQGRFMCVHGGISPTLTHLEDIESVDRKREPGISGGLCDLLWSDPLPNGEKNEASNHCDKSTEENDVWLKNDTRGCSFYYTLSAVEKFLKMNNLLCIIRAHEVQSDGYDYPLYENQTIDSKRIFPPVVSVFSAPNYCDTYDNMGAYLFIGEEANELQFKQFNAIPHPIPICISSTKSHELFARVKKVLPYVPASKQFFEKLAFLRNLKDHSFASFCGHISSSSSSFSEGLEQDMKDKKERQKDQEKESTISRGIDKQRINEMHPTALHQSLNEKAEKWLEYSKIQNRISGNEKSQIKIMDENPSQIFSCEELKIMVQHLLFALMDFGGDSLIRKTDIVHFVRNILEEKISPTAANLYFLALDMNSDGRIDFPDLLNAVALLKTEYISNYDAENENGKLYFNEESEEDSKGWRVHHVSKTLKALAFVLVFFLFSQRKKPWVKKLKPFIHSHCFLYIILGFCGFISYMKSRKH